MVIGFTETFANVSNAGDQHQAGDGQGANHYRETTEWGQPRVLVTIDDRLVGASRALAQVPSALRRSVPAGPPRLDCGSCMRSQPR